MKMEKEKQILTFFYTLTRINFIIFLFGILSYLAEQLSGNTARIGDRHNSEKSMVQPAKERKREIERTLPSGGLPLPYRRVLAFCFCFSFQNIGLPNVNCLAFKFTCN